MIALQNNGLDCIETNAEALCNACHATKTLRERIEWENRRTQAILKAKEDAKMAHLQCHYRGTSPCWTWSLDQSFLRIGS